jgi:hypothetical protein
MSTLHSFCWYELRTTDPNAARAFYAEIAGWQASGQPGLFHVGKHRVGGLLELPERARLLGAPAHWLGHIAVVDVDASAQRLAALGAQVLGPVQQAEKGGRVAILRDPQGAVVALSSREDVGSREGIAWHELHTTDHEKAWSTYADLFGWQATEALDLGPGLGHYQMFSWASGDRNVGGMVSSARAPHIHTHWLFYLTVADLDASLAKARSLGGVVLNGPTQVRGGHRIAQLEDPQGAAFGLYQYAREGRDDT